MTEKKKYRFQSVDSLPPAGMTEDEFLRRKYGENWRLIKKFKDRNAKKADE